MNIVSVINQKGGVGKTTTTANLGACLAMRGLRTLLIDMDPQANLTLGLGMSDQKLPHGLDSVLINPDEAPLGDMLRQVGDLPLYLAAGSVDLAACEKMLTPIIGSAYRMRRALDLLAKAQPFDWVLIDCPPSLGRLTEIAIIASNYLLIPTEPKFYSFAGMDTLNHMIVGMNKDLGLRVQLLGVLLTMVERNARLHRTIAEEIRQRFGNKVFDTVIYKNLRLSEAEVDGKPIILYDPRASGARNYSALAEEVLQRTGGSTAAAGARQG
jgi:chromosome partitioning protein